MNTVGVTDYTNLWHPLSISDGKMSKFNTHQIRKKICNVHKMGSAHLQCVKNHHVKNEYKGMNTVGVTDYTNLRHPLSISDEKNV